MLECIVLLLGFLRFLFTSMTSWRIAGPFLFPCNGLGGFGASMIVGMAFQFNPLWLKKTQPPYSNFTFFFAFFVISINQYSDRNTLTINEQHQLTHLGAL